MKRWMKQFYNQEAYTLFELIISLMIISVLILAFLSVFAFSIKVITSAGNNSKASYMVQEDLDVSLEQEAALSSVSKNMLVNFKNNAGSPVTISVDITEIMTTKTYGDRTVVVKTLIP